MTSKTSERIRMISSMAMLTAIAVAADMFLRLPNIGGFLTYEPKDVIYDWGLDFNCGSAVKYIARYQRKGNPIQDLKKAIQYLEFEIEALERKENT